MINKRVLDPSSPHKTILVKTTAKELAKLVWFDHILSEPFTSFIEQEREIWDAMTEREQKQFEEQFLKIEGRLLKLLGFDE